MKKIIITMLTALVLTFLSGGLYAKTGNETEKVTYVVSMHCQNCVNKLTDKLSFQKGVKDFKISLDDKTIVITYDPAKIQKTKFESTIKKLGYTYEEVEAKESK